MIVFVCNNILPFLLNFLLYVFVYTYIYIYICIYLIYIYNVYNIYSLLFICFIYLVIHFSYYKSFFVSLLFFYHFLFGLYSLLLIFGNSPCISALYIESNFSVVTEWKVLLNTNVKPKTFGLDMAWKEILSQLFNPLNLTIKACTWKHGYSHH